MADRLSRLEPKRARLQQVALDDGRWLIRDEQKSGLETIEVALDLLSQIPAPRKICVLGAITEPVGPQGKVYRDVGAQVAAAADLAVFVGETKPMGRYRAGAVAAGK